MRKNLSHRNVATALRLVAAGLVMALLFAAPGQSQLASAQTPPTQTESPTETSTATTPTATPSVCESRTPKTGDREVLEILYCATRGDNWSDTTNWMSDKPLDEWFGVTTDDDGRVTKLSTYIEINGIRYGNNLIGTLPGQLGNLSELERLDLSRNYLSGSIPPELGNLSNLKWLYLYNNNLSGSIPPELGNLSNLLSLYLSYNFLSGPIPPELGKLHGSSLRLLRLRGNDFTGCVPDELHSVWSNDVDELELPTCLAVTGTHTPTPTAHPRLLPQRRPPFLLNVFRGRRRWATGKFWKSSTAPQAATTGGTAPTG